VPASSQARRRHPDLEDMFAAFPDFVLTTKPRVAAARGSISDANMRPARLLAEVKDVAANHHPQYEDFLSEADIGLEGPYLQGTFLLYMHMEEDYASMPPKARFCTPTIHPNINSILNSKYFCITSRHRWLIWIGKWTADTSNTQILNKIYSLLLEH